MDAPPVRFAQSIGFVLSASALHGLVIGVDGISYVVLVAPVVRACAHVTTGVCLGRRIYLLAHRR